METEEKLIVAGAAVLAGYILYKNFLAAPLSDQSGAAALSSAGLTTSMPPRTSKFSPAVTAQAGSTVYGFLPGEFSNLNFAQRILIGLDKIVPGTFLTNWALS